MSTKAPDDAPRRRARPKGWRALVGWLAPFVLAGLAVNVHASLHVPRRLPLPQPDKNKRKPAAPATKPSARPSTTKSSGATRDKTSLKTPRAARRLDSLWRRYEAQPFSEEPVNAGFDNAHRPLTQRLASQLRERTFRSAPEQPLLTIVGTSCRTIRCEIIVHAPSRHEIELYADSLYALQRGKQPLMRDVEGVFDEPERELEEPSEEESALIAARFVFAFSKDLPDLDLDDDAESSPTSAPKADSKTDSTTKSSAGLE
ncbi:MAG: hypothetical protein KC468_27430 [Myxococcales bacterium]|nr:hypothetical protein [Myxococcales bacterium]